jgi:ATP-dependent helicase/nuclease subunit A
VRDQQIDLREVRDFLPARLATSSAKSTLIDSDAVRLGSAWHAVLERAASAAALETLDSKALAHAYELDASQTAAVLDAARTVMTADHLGVFFSSPSDRELELVGANGELLRIDRMVACDGALWVLDYKWRVGEDDRAEYARQIGRYCDVVRAIYPGQRVRGALICADGSFIALG